MKQRMSIRRATWIIIAIHVAVIVALFLSLSRAHATAVRYPITVISGTTTGYVDTLILPTGMIVSNLPGGGSMLVATGLSTSVSSGGSLSTSQSNTLNSVNVSSNGWNFTSWVVGVSSSAWNSAVATLNSSTGLWNSAVSVLA